MVEEAHVYVQASRLKTCATLLIVRFVNSPITSMALVVLHLRIRGFKCITAKSF